MKSHFGVDPVGKADAVGSSASVSVCDAAAMMNSFVLIGHELSFDQLVTSSTIFIIFIILFSSFPFPFQLHPGVVGL